jgi:hypothetical protein
VPVTGSVTLDDDGAGNVALTEVSLAHVPYQVGLPPFISVVLTRSSITLGSGPAAGTGSTLSSVVFGSSAFANSGTIQCTSGIVACADLLQIPDGTFNLPPPGNLNLGTWTFDGLGGLSASFPYVVLAGASAAETLFLVGSTTPIPEPGTGLLSIAGLIAMSRVRRR